MSDLIEREAALKPCPFCGGDKIELSEGTTFRWRYVGCSECGAQMEFRSDNRFEPTEETWKDAAEAWNRRTSTHPSAEAVSMLREAIPLLSIVADDGAPTPLAQDNACNLIKRIRAISLDSIAAKPVLNQQEQAVGVAQMGDRAFAAPPQGLVHELLWTAEHAPFVTKQAAKVMREAASALSQREGYVMVPVEPTDAMCEVGRERHCFWDDGKLHLRSDVAADIYKAMLSAAPGREGQDANERGRG